MCRNLVLVEDVKALGVVVKGPHQFLQHPSVDGSVARRGLGPGSRSTARVARRGAGRPVHHHDALELGRRNSQNPKVVLLVGDERRKGRVELVGGNGVPGDELLLVGKMRPQQLKDLLEGLEGRIFQRPVEGIRADLVFVVHGDDADRGRGLHGGNRRGGRLAGRRIRGRIGILCLLLFGCVLLGRRRRTPVDGGRNGRPALFAAFVFHFLLEVRQNGFDVLKGLRTKLEKGRRLSADKVSLGVANDEPGTSQLTVSPRHVVPGGNPPVHDDGRPLLIVLSLPDGRILPKPVGSVKVEGDGLGLDADLQKLNVFHRRRPTPHLCRAGAAPASPAVVKGNDGGLAAVLGQQGRAGGQLLVDAVAGVSADQMDVKVPDRLPEAGVAKCHDEVVVVLCRVVC